MNHLTGLVFGVSGIWMGLSWSVVVVVGFRPTSAFMYMFCHGSGDKLFVCWGPGGSSPVYVLSPERQAQVCCHHG